MSAAAWRTRRPAGLGLPPAAQGAHRRAQERAQPVREREPPHRRRRLRSPRDQDEGLGRRARTLKADKKALVVDAASNDNLVRSIRNVADHQFLPPEGVNVYDLLTPRSPRAVEGRGEGARGALPEVTREYDHAAHQRADHQAPDRVDGEGQPSSRGQQPSDLSRSLPRRTRSRSRTPSRRSSA
jgi:hypothetical protein